MMVEKMGAVIALSVFLFAAVCVPAQRPIRDREGSSQAPAGLREEVLSKPSSAVESLTLIHVGINPLGAIGDVPWKVHYTALNVRNLPSTSGSSVLGTLLDNAETVGEYYIVQESDEEWINITYDNQNAWISRTGVSRVHPTNQELINDYGNLPYGREIVNRWWGIPIEYEPDDLVYLPASYTYNNSSTFQLRSEAAAAVMALIDSAHDDGVELRVLSPYRSGARQEAIYDNAVNTDGLSQRYSAPPGHSEHQLGSTTDFADPATHDFVVNPSPQYSWLTAHGAEFGFRQTYRPNNIDETGYIEEPWHWRYMGVAVLSSDRWVFD